jgi:putative flippase GtrA
MQTLAEPPARVSATLIRFVVNGIVATAAHYATLVLLLEVVGLRSAGLANGLAAIVGISVSYLGNYKHVFRSDAAHAQTLPRFLCVYVLVALMHALVLAAWTDYFRLSYHLGFVIATGLSVMLTFIGNMSFVFRKAPRDSGDARPDVPGVAGRSADGRDQA